MKALIDARCRCLSSRKLTAVMPLVACLPNAIGVVEVEDSVARTSLLISLRQEGRKI